MRRPWTLVGLWFLSLVVALNTGRQLVYTIFYLLTLLLILSYLWAWANIHWLQIERITRSRRSQVGRVAEERFEVHNPSRLPKLWLEIQDHSSLPSHHVSQVVSSLRSLERRQWNTRTTCRQRGRFTLGPLTLASGDPLGLFRIERHIPATSPFLVYPLTEDLPAFSPREGQLTGGEATRRRTHYITTNVSGVRDYEPGDSFNRIHWRSTARTGRLVVKEFELDPTADLWVVLDMNADVHVTRASFLNEGEDEFDNALIPAVLQKRRKDIVVELPPATEEYGVALAASVARHYLRRNRAVGMIAYSQRREIAMVDRGERQLNRILEMLSVMQADGNMPFPHVLLSEGRHLSRHTTVIAISPSLDTKWAQALRELGRRGIRSVAISIAGDSFMRNHPLARQRTPQPLLNELLYSGIPTYLVRQGDSLAEALGHQVGLQDGRSLAMSNHDSDGDRLDETIAV